MDDVLLPHLDRLPALPAGCSTERFPAARPGWAAALHRLMTGPGHAPPPAQAVLPGVHVGRAYVDLSFGQMHVRGALGGPGMPLLLLHGLPGSARAMRPVLERWAGQRPVLAPDLPGAGESDALPDATPDAVLAALLILCDQLMPGPLEVEGSGTGAILARALHRRDPGRFILGTLDAMPLPGATPPEPGLFAPHPFGAHLLAAWHHVRDAAILGGWERREPAPFDTLDQDSLHLAAIELVKARADPAPLIAALLALELAET